MSNFHYNTAPIKRAPPVVDIETFHNETLRVRSVLTKSNVITTTDTESLISPLSPSHNKGKYVPTFHTSIGEPRIGSGMIAGMLVFEHEFEREARE